MSIFEAILLALIEGITEFIPVSSTGHLIIASHFLNLGENEFTQAFNIVIQFGAILSVLLLYRQEIITNRPLAIKVIVAFIPTAVIGLSLKSFFDDLLDNVVVVSAALIVGGVILILLERFMIRKMKVTRTVDQLSLKQCVFIGAVQSFALIPGVSRSASSIIGGIFCGLSREDAAKFSFLLAVPTLGAASALKFLDLIAVLNSENAILLMVGFFFAFVFSYIAIKFFIKMLNTFGFEIFGYYRIALGALVFWLLTT